MADDLSISFDRITYRGGQALTSRDMNDEQRRHALLRAAHNRYLHDTWGIALGFQVEKAPDFRAVFVGAGYAIDEAGRDLVLSKSIGIPVPVVAGPEVFVLTATFREDAAFLARAKDSDRCQDDPGDRPDFHWLRPLGVRFGLHIPLVAVSVIGGMIQGQLNFGVRRYARPDIRPHLRMETTTGGQTGWKVWGISSSTTIGIDVIVDTSEAGFHNTPQYFAALQGDFSNRPSEAPLFAAPGWPAASQGIFSPTTFGFIGAPFAQHFVYRLPCLGPPFARMVSPAEAESRGWRVAWLGLESVAGSVSPFDLTKIITLLAAI